jgi:hypothetical protein
MLFRRNEDKRARDDAAQAEIDRLKDLAPEQLAVELLPALGSDALKGRLSGVRVQEIIKELLAGVDHSMRVNDGVLLLPVREALQRLEHANLVMQMAPGVDRATHWRITSTGEQALSAGDAAQRLGATAA